ncbi:MAG: CpsD/CapB family tyrosine-protein kinase [Clostridia bacterium]|nr:CpsD/CapB family tyrosine-protein kinase [Clostridia bacterium]
MKKTEDSNVPALSEIVGHNRSFAMSEAHKRLRTNVIFSFADDSECHVVGITSAMAHEGKSTTAINLAYDMMKAGKKTLLIDADMRLSHIAKILNISRAPGLSNMLVGNNNGQDLVQHATEHGGLPVISCGDIPPNPTEILSSKRFALMLTALKKVYEYIIIDLPPVGEVSDALIASKLIDGMVIVVRQEFVDKRALDDTVHQLLLSEARIIGFVVTCSQHGPKYSKYKHKKKYGGRYGYRGLSKKHGYGYSGRHDASAPTENGFTGKE